VRCVRLRGSGCGASTAKPPAAADDKPASQQGAPPSVRTPNGANAAGSSSQKPATTVVMVLGLDSVSGKEAVCQQLCAAIGCTYIDVDTVIKAEVANNTDLGSEIAVCARQGKIMPASMTARAVKAALAAGPGGIYLLSGPPKSMELDSFERHVGTTPQLALLFELPEADGRERLAAHGLDESAVNTRLSSFQQQTGALVKALEGRGLLRRVDASASADATLASARAHMETLGVAKSGAAKQPAAKLAVKFVLALGGPGVDTAAHCARLAHKFSYIHLSNSEVMRAEIEAQTTTGMSVSLMIRAGKVVPTSLTIEMLQNIISKHPSATYLIEGFPRTLGAFSVLEDRLGTCMRAVLFEGADDPADDDNLARQMRTFKSQTLPVVAALESRGHLMKIDGTTDSEAVFECACKAFA